MDIPGSHSRRVIATRSTVVAVTILLLSSSMLAKAVPGTRSLMQGLPEADEGCICSLLYDPFCDIATKKTYGNACEAGCAKIPSERLVPGECAITINSPRAIKSCICTEQYDPVCDTASNKTYGNNCVAACAKVPTENITHGECRATESCRCTKEYDPVCDTANNKTYGNKCEAACAQVSKDKLDDGECPRKSSGSNVCVCYLIYMPVCDTVTGLTYSNDCQAKCNGVPLQQLIPGSCPDSAASCVKNCSMDLEKPVFAPVCIISSNPASSLSIKKTTEMAGNPTWTSATFVNPCIANCYRPSPLGSYTGSCNASADGKCAGKLKEGESVCSTSGSEDPSICYAQQLHNSGKSETYSGLCKQKEAVKILSRCPSDRQSIRCFAEPCSVSTCHTPGAVCVSKYCQDYFRSAFLNGLCQAVWVNTDGTINGACTFKNDTTA